jgi:hypothetical protein
MHSTARTKMSCASSPINIPFCDQHPPPTPPDLSRTKSHTFSQSRMSCASSVTNRISPPPPRLCVSPPLSCVHTLLVRGRVCVCVSAGSVCVCVTLTHTHTPLSLGHVHLGRQTPRALLQVVTRFYARFRCV